ncbi:MAG: hypothetical protein F6K11_21020 [Leptolyngbya sp. SIO3F4]|nr:hypothetical protein [Leptolyngbya sp. SIO3F4]
MKRRLDVLRLNPLMNHRKRLDHGWRFTLGHFLTAGGAVPVKVAVTDMTE